MSGMRAIFSDSRVAQPRARDKLAIGPRRGYGLTMNRDEIIATLRAHEADLRQRGVQHVALFGSVARGDATAASDIDIMLDLDPTAPIGLFAYAGLKRYIAELFPGRVDVVNREALKPALRRPALADRVYAF